MYIYLMIISNGKVGLSRVIQNWMNAQCEGDSKLYNRRSNYWSDNCIYFSITNFKIEIRLLSTSFEQVLQGTLTRKP